MKNRTKISVAQVDQYELIMPLIHRMYQDIQELTKKKQDGVLSKTRVDMINKLLDNARHLLQNEASAAFLERLDLDLIPQNADAMLIIGQYVSALVAFKQRYTAGDAFDKYWLTGDNMSRKAG